MPAIPACLRPRKGRLDRRKKCPGNVALAIHPRPAPVVGQVMAAIEHNPIGALEIFEQAGRSDQHASTLDGLGRRRKQLSDAAPSAAERGAARFAAAPPDCGRPLNAAAGGEFPVHDWRHAGGEMFDGPHDLTVRQRAVVDQHRSSRQTAEQTMRRNHLFGDGLSVTDPHRPGRTAWRVKLRSIRLKVSRSAEQKVSAAPVVSAKKTMDWTPTVRFCAA